MSIAQSTKNTSRKNRSLLSLNCGLERKLLAYAAAASAAGAGIVALSQTSQAEIVFTPAHQMVPMRGHLALDLNGDGVTDFTFRNIIGSCGLDAKFPECSQFTSQVLEVYGNSALNGAWAAGTRGASALPAGTKVGSGVKFANAGVMESCGTVNGAFEGSYGKWVNVQNRYLGLAFTIAGEVHYGWARLSVTVKHGTCRPTIAVLTGYAYETVAGKPIATGQRSGPEKVSVTERPHATLGLLARGSIGLAAWRRDENAARL